MKNRKQLVRPIFFKELIFDGRDIIQFQLKEMHGEWGLKIKIYCLSVMVKNKASLYTLIALQKYQGLLFGSRKISFLYYIILEMNSRKYKRKALRAQKKEDELQSNPTTPSIFLDSKQFTTKGIDQNDPKCRSQALLNLIHYAGVMQLFKESIKKFKGTNSTLSYQPSYNFSEKWEDTSKTKFQKNQNVYLSANGIFFLVAIIVMVHKIPMIWYMSIHSIFEFGIEPYWFLAGILFAVADLLLKIYLVYGEMIKNASSEQISQFQFKKTIASYFVADLLTLLVYFTELIQQKSGFTHNYFSMLLDFVVVFIQSRRFLQIYNTLLIFLISFKYKDYVNLFGFISKLFIILHICSILVYSISYLDSENNWIKHINKNDAGPIAKYIYSVYFTGTTMFTVGYGDIIPTNLIEMPVILIIQVLGLVVMGYIISEIGHTLSVMRQAQDDFQQDIQNADTICNNYQLGSDLKHKVRNYIVNNRLASEELNVKQEQNFLMKLNQELRSEVNHINHLNIIKTSLFFICNWSKKMQNEVSRKLQKFFLSPNERIAKLTKLYIVTNGKIDVYTERRTGSKLFCRKHLKTIQRDPTKQVFSNVFGCTSLFTGKPNNLAAVSKDFAVCYGLDYAEILQILKDDDRDFEFYHETKCKLEQETFSQKFEVPDLINNRQHYCPTRYIVLRKYKKELISRQDREEILRFKRKMKRVCLQKEQYQSPPSESDNDNSENQDVDNNLPKSSKVKKNINLSITPNRCDTPNRSCISFRSYKRRFFSRLDEQRAKQKEMNELLQNNVVRTSKFEIGKQFGRYFKQGNCTHILGKYSKNAIKNFKEINSKEMRMDWIDLLIFAQKLHKTKVI